MLILEGEIFKDQILNNKLINWDDYEKWIAKSILFLEKDYKDTSLTKRFLKASEDENGKIIENYYKMLGVLKALEELEAVRTEKIKNKVEKPKKENVQK